MPKVVRSHSTPHFERQFEKLPKNIQKLAAKKLLIFEGNTNHPGLKAHKLKGTLSAFWSFSISDKYRVLFRFLGNSTIIYYDIDTHDIYK